MTNKKTQKNETISGGNDMMDKFVQLHLLTSYPPSNLNRDDNGRPKTAKMGGVDRLRISSQCDKRTWRMSDIFQESMSDYTGTRTKELGLKVYKILIEQNIKEKDAKEWSKAIAGVFGKLKPEKKDKPLEDLEIEQLVHVSPEETKAIDDLVNIIVKEKRAPKGEELVSLLRQPETAVDIALWGRMLAANPKYNVEAACQVSHPISVHQVVIEDDYFTALDDLNNGSEDLGASHIGERGFASGLFYTYICLDRKLLLDNLGNNEELTDNAIKALVETIIKVSPKGMQNSFASRAYASYVLAEKSNAQPRSLATAFLKPVTGTNYLEDSIKLLNKIKQNMDKAYEVEIKHYEFDAHSGKGTISELISFIVNTKKV